ncbi:hypothetical protein GY45DRAFT_680387 [Cubamyces sp. BRFM 1775]|nr:hypothetical protein GY45DRAFT_680387 [Cubamyces sp. BRFM 1775]
MAPTWDFSYRNHHQSDSKPALSHTLSKRRGQQLRSAFREQEHAADADTPSSYPRNDTPFPRMSSSDENLPRDVQEHSGRVQEGTLPREFTQRTIRRKKSSFDLRDLFLSGELTSTRSSTSDA